MGLTPYEQQAQLLPKQLIGAGAECQWEPCEVGGRNAERLFVKVYCLLFQKFGMSPDAGQASSYNKHFISL